MRRAPLPGHRGAYRASWYDHGHLDAYRLYRGDVGPALRISCSLKSIARFVGLAPVEVDRTRIHDLSNEALHAYAASDARLARILTERRWGTASRFIDRVAPEDAEPAAVLFRRGVRRGPRREPAHRPLPPSHPDGHAGRLAIRGSPPRPPVVERRSACPPPPPAGAAIAALTTRSSRRWPASSTRPPPTTPAT